MRTLPFMVLALAACEESVIPPGAPPCGTASEPLPLDQPSSLGFSPDDVVADFGTVSGALVFDLPGLDPMDLSVAPRAAVSASENEQPDLPTCFPGRSVGVTMVWDLSLGGASVVAADPPFDNWLVGYEDGSTEFRARSNEPGLGPIVEAIARAAYPDATDVTPMLVRVGDDTGAVVAEFLYDYVAPDGEIVHDRVTAALAAP